MSPDCIYVKLYVIATLTICYLIYFFLVIFYLPKQIPYGQNHLFSALSRALCGSETQMFKFPTGLTSYTHAHQDDIINYMKNEINKYTFGRRNCLEDGDIYANTITPTCSAWATSQFVTLLNVKM